jgi:hypothetical protein
VDELVDRLATIIPSRSSREGSALQGMGNAARSSLRSSAEDQEEWNEDGSMLVSVQSGQPMTLEQALDALDDAARKGEASKWVSILSRQLNAEREQDLEGRRQRVAMQSQRI